MTDSSQRSLDDLVAENRPGPSKRSAPETSRVAGESIEAASGSIRAKIYELYEELGPMSDERLIREYQARYGAAYFVTLQARRSELVKDRFLEDSGNREISSWGRPRVVWRIVQY